MPERQLSKRRGGRTATARHQIRAQRREREKNQYGGDGERASTAGLSPVSGRLLEWRQGLFELETGIADITQAAVHVLVEAASQEIAESTGSGCWQRVPFDVTIQHPGERV